MAFERGPLPFERLALAFEARDQGPERFHVFGMAGIFALFALVPSPAHFPERFHAFGVAGIFAVGPLVSGPAHLPDAKPDGPHAYGGDRELPDCDPFCWCHGVSLFPSSSNNRSHGK